MSKKFFILFYKKQKEKKKVYNVVVRIFLCWSNDVAAAVNSLRRIKFFIYIFFFNFLQIPLWVEIFLWNLIGRFNYNDKRSLIEIKIYGPQRNLTLRTYKTLLTLIIEINWILNKRTNTKKCFLMWASLWHLRKVFIIYSYNII